MRLCMVCLLLQWLPAQAQTFFSFNENCKKAYALSWQFKTQEAANLLKQEATENPNNLLPLYIQSVNELTVVFLKEDDNSLKKFLLANDLRIKKLNSAPKHFAYSYYCRAELYIHNALVHVKQKSYITAAYEIHKAYNLLEEGQKKYPQFLPLKKDLLLMKAAIGTLPDNYKSLLAVLGIKGNLQQSVTAYSLLVQEVKTHSDYNFLWRETAIIHGFLQYYLLNNQQNAWHEISAATADYTENMLTAVLRSAMGQRFKQNDAALEALQHHTKEIPASPLADYYFGLAKLNKLQPDAAYYLARFLKNHNGQNLVKEGYLKLGWAYLVNSDEKQYRNCVKLVQYYGAAQLDEDKQALREAQRKEIPKIPLLKARLLFDGGYSKQALAQLQNVSTQNYTAEEKAEYLYRMARIQTVLKDDANAISNYEKLISNYTEKEGYFVPAAALYLAQLYEFKGNIALARVYYKKCLSYKNYIYKDSFDQKAKAGLERVGS